MSEETPAKTAHAVVDEIAAPQDVGAFDDETPDHVSAGKTPKVIVVAVVLAALALALRLLQSLSGFIAPIFLGVNLLIAAYPIYTWMLKAKCPKALAAVVTGTTVFAVLVLGLVSVAWSLTEMVQTLTHYSAQFYSLYSSLIEWLSQFGFDQAKLLSSLQSISPSSVIDVLSGLVAKATTASSLIVVMAVAIVFMMMDLPSVSRRLAITHRLHPDLTDSLASFVLGVRRYWLVTTLFGLIVAAFDWVLLVVLAVPLPLVWAVLSFVTNYIPNVGFIIGLVPPALLGLFEGGPMTALAVVIGYSVLNFVIQTIIQPKFTGDAVGVTPTVSFVSLLLWSWVFGVLGALVALPATLAVKALLIDPDPRLRWVNAFISNDPGSIKADKV